MPLFDFRARASTALRRRWPIAAALLAASWLFSGCQGGYDMKVDALSRPKTAKVADQEAVSYRIRNRTPGIEDDSLRYKEAAGYVKTALSGKGMYEAPEGQKADLVVELDYGISAPKVGREMRSDPVFAMVPGAVTYETVQVGTRPDGSPIMQTIVTQQPPTQEYVGERKYMVTVVTYEKHLRLSARENKPSIEGQPAPEVWTVDVSSEGESRDLRKYLPALTAATIDYIGTDTRGQKSVRLKEEKNGAVAFVKKGL